MSETKRMQKGGAFQVRNAIIEHYPEFSRLLLERQEEVIRHEQVARSQLDEQVPSGPGDVGDESILDTSTDYFLNLANSQQKELLEIKSALERMHRGIYGICELCEEEISLDRLRKLPFARHCVDCQTNKERHLRVHRLTIFPKL